MALIVATTPASLAIMSWQTTVHGVPSNPLQNLHLLLPHL